MSVSTGYYLPGRCIKAEISESLRRWYSRAGGGVVTERMRSTSSKHYFYAFLPLPLLWSGVLISHGLFYTLFFIFRSFFSIACLTVERNKRTEEEVNANRKDQSTSISFTFLSPLFCCFPHPWSVLLAFSFFCIYIFFINLISA